MSNPRDCCQSKRRFIRQINGNFMHSMVIPEWFVNCFGGKISGTIKLEAPNGNIYDVRVTENMNRTILKTGWTAFVDANQIRENYSLMFQYLGNTRFQVTIFDSDGTEKALYSCVGKETASDVRKPCRHDADNLSSSRDGTTQSSACKGSDSDRCPRGSSCHYCNLTKTPTLSYTSEEFSEEENTALDDSEESDNHQLVSEDYVLSGCYDLTEAQAFEINALVEKIRPKIPVLVVVIKKSNVIPHCRLGIPKDYTLKYFPCQDTNITLQLPRKNKNWKCKFSIRPSSVSGAGRSDISFGEFVRDNNVREGDICLLQPMANVKKRRFTVTVHLFHKASVDNSPGENNIGSHNGRTASTACVKVEPATDGQEISSSGNEDHGSSDNSEGASKPPFILPDRTHLTQAQKKKVLEKVSAIESELPIYVAVMNKTSAHTCHRSPYLCIGTRYVSRCLENKCTTTGHHGKRSNINELRRRGERIHSMNVCKGWSSFSRINNLREGDICLFKLIENEEPLKMMVYIIHREKC